MDQTSEPVASSKAARVNEGHGSRFCLLLRRALAEGAVGAVLVVVRDVLGENLLKVTAVEDQEPVEALAGLSQRTFPRTRSLSGIAGCSDNLRAARAEHLVKADGELGVPVTDKVLESPRALGDQGAQVAGLLGHPLPDGLAVTLERWNPPGVDFDEEENVEALEQHGVDGKEVAGEESGRLASYELRPSQAGPARGTLDVVPAKDIPYGRGRDLDAHPGQFPWTRR